MKLFIVRESFPEDGKIMELFTACDTEEEAQLYAKDVQADPASSVEIRSIEWAMCEGVKLK